MGLLDALLGGYSGGGLLGSPSSWSYPTSAPDAGEEKKKQDAAFLAAISQNPDNGASVGGVSNSPWPSILGGAPPQQPALPGVNPSQIGGSTPFGMGGINLPAQSTGAPAAGAFPAVPFTPPQAAAPPMPPPQASAPQPPPPQDNPTSVMNIGGPGGYQMPQFGSAPQTAPATDVSAQSRQPQPDQPLPPAFGGGGYFDRIHNGGGLISSLFSNGTAQQQNLRAQYDATQQALIAAGKSPKEASSLAMLAVLNPEAGKTLLPEALTNKTDLKMVKDATGAEHPYSWNSREQTFKPVGADGETTGGASNGFGMYAPGVSQIDSSKSGEDYLKQFSPEVKAAAKSYINGDVMPTGNPRTQGITTLAKTVAQKYGQDTGVPVNDQTYAAKRKMQTDLAASGNSSMGGILSNGKSSFKHLAEYTDSAADLGNASHDFPLGGAIAHAQNAIGNTLGGSNTNAKIKAINDNLGHYGQESTKFYAASGGGVEERTNALKQMNPVHNSSEEMAAYAEKEKNLMLDRFHEKEAQIRDVMGEKYLQEHPVFTPELQRDISRIDANVARLRGNAPSGNTTKTGVTWSVVK